MFEMEVETDNVMMMIVQRTVRQIFIQRLWSAKVNCQDYLCHR